MTARWKTRASAAAACLVITAITLLLQHYARPALALHPQSTLAATAAWLAGWLPNFLSTIAFAAALVVVRVDARHAIVCSVVFHIVYEISQAIDPGLVFDAWDLAATLAALLGWLRLSRSLQRSGRPQQDSSGRPPSLT